MAKEIAGKIKLQKLKGGAANPAPPIGPALGSKGINIMDFCKQYNARTQPQAGKILLPALITYYTDKTFDFVVKTSPAAVQLSESAIGAPVYSDVLKKVVKASAQPNRKKVGEVSWDTIKKIAENKMVDMNCFTLQSAMKMIAGTARSMGITVAGPFPDNV
jgi:large subunit ribosomal protein L11